MSPLDNLSLFAVLVPQTDGSIVRSRGQQSVPAECQAADGASTLKRERRHGLILKVPHDCFAVRSGSRQRRSVRSKEDLPGRGRVDRKWFTDLLPIHAPETDRTI